jgi:putative ABC transport system permease protein
MTSVRLPDQLFYMFKNYLVATFRNISKNKTYSFLNFFGLAIGVACAGLIFLWVEDEMSYDQQYVNHDRLGQVMTNQTYDGVTRTFRSTPGQLGPALVQELPGIMNASRAAQNRALFTIGDKALFEKGLYVDSSFFPMFTLQFLAGNSRDAFRELHSVVISEKMAKQFFGKTDNIIGKTIRVDNTQDYTVSGIFTDPGANSTLQFDWLSPWGVFAAQNDWLKYWGANGPQTYIQFAPQTGVEQINKSIAGFIHGKDERISTQPIVIGMNDWHLRNNFAGGKQTGGRIEFVRLFGIIAWIILIIACINFMNLATARSAKRAREVGVRKVLGAGKRALIGQFMGEAMTMAFISVLLGILFIQLLLPFFNSLIETDISLGLDQPRHLAAAFSIAIFCGLVAGSYPSLYLSSFNPIYVFKGLKLKTGGAVLIRKTLVGFQFTISIALIICTVLVYQQVKHIKNRDLGYDKDLLLEIPMTGKMKDNFNAIRHDLLSSGKVENVATCNTQPLYTANNGSNFSWEGKDPESVILISNRSISPDYLQTMGMHLVEGRGFQPDIKADSSNVIITETLAHLLGKGPAVGEIIRAGDTPLTVVGVVKDYVYGDMYGKPDPVIFYPDLNDASFLYVRYKKNADIPEALASTTAIVKKNNPGYPVEYSFVDDQFATIFKSETLVGNLSKIFAALAIFISCLGLFGLSAFTAEQRTKEIGIRKVLGANTTGIITMLSKDFLRIVFIAILLATPLSFYFMNRWLQDFSYRISIGWWVFFFAGLAAILIAMFTISFQAIKVAMINPVKSMRSE